MVLLPDHHMVRVASLSMLQLIVIVKIIKYYWLDCENGREFGDSRSEDKYRRLTPAAAARLSDLAETAPRWLVID